MINCRKTIFCIGIISISLTGCTSSWTSSSSFKTEADTQSGLTNKRETTVVFNNNENRCWTQNTDGHEWKIQAAGNIKFSKGEPVEWSKNSVVKLSERRTGFSREAEMRPTDQSKMQLWIKDGDAFKQGDKTDEQWAREVLAKAGFDDRPQSEKVADFDKMSVAEAVVKDELAKLSQGDDVVAVLRKKVQTPSLSAKEQILLIDAILDQVYIDSDKTDLLLQLIKRKDHTKEAGKYLVGQIDKIHYDADRKRILTALVDK